MEQLPRYRSGDPRVDEQIAELVDALGEVGDPELVFELVATAARLARDRADRGDLKIANSSLKEMRYAFSVFAPYRAARKVAIFGSARTASHDPLYEQTSRFAAAMAKQDWMVITGAGPGIMEAGIEGAGAEHSFGVGIRLPFEAETTQVLAEDPKLVNFRYFFTRKLTFVKEAHAFCLLPGGFGTMDEAFELLTLVQTGKTNPAPVVLLDIPGGRYWQRWRDFVAAELVESGYIDSRDLDLVHVTDDPADAVEEITRFYDNYHSPRFVGSRLVLRLQHAPSDDRLAALNHDFADIVERGTIERIGPTDSEIADDDHVHLPRLAFRFDRHHWARLRHLIDALNAATS